MESAIGKVGLIMNTDIGARKLTKLIKAEPSLLNGLIVHSQGTIKLAQVLRELNKTEEGKKIIRENAKEIVFADPAIGSKELEKVQEILGKDKVKILNNEKDILNYMTGNEVTTNERGGHSIKNYNINFKLSKEGNYERPEKLKKNKKNIEGKLEKLNENSTKSIIQRVEKMSSITRMGENNEKIID